MFCQRVSGMSEAWKGWDDPPKRKAEASPPAQKVTTLESSPELLSDLPARSELTGWRPLGLVGGAQDGSRFLPDKRSLRNPKSTCSNPADQPWFLCPRPGVIRAAPRGVRTPGRHHTAHASLFIELRIHTGSIIQQIISRAG